MWYKHRSSNTTPTNPSHTRQSTYWTSFRSTRNIRRPSSSGALSHNTTTWWRDGMDQYIRPGSVWQYKPRVFSASVYIYSGNTCRLLVWLWTSGNHSKSCRTYVPNILLPSRRSVWENIYPDSDYRPNTARTVHATKVKILPIRLPKLLRCLLYGKREQFNSTVIGNWHFCLRTAISWQFARCLYIIFLMRHFGNSINIVRIK